jgi:hypothetical protein
MFSMAPAALTTSKLSKELMTAQQLHAALRFQNSERVLSLGINSLDEALPQHGLVQGSVTELRARGASGAATSFALCACRAAQNIHREWQGSSSAELGQYRPWCAFIDPTGSLFAPGVAQLGVELDRLLVVRPDLKSVERVAVRIAEAKVVAVLVIDLRGALAGDLSVDGPKWQRTIRRLSLAVKHLPTCVLVITGGGPRLALPLPVAMRLELNRLSCDAFELRVAKERTGRITRPHTIPWSAFTTAATPAAQVTP